MHEMTHMHCANDIQRMSELELTMAMRDVDDDVSIASSSSSSSALTRTLSIALNSQKIRLTKSFIDDGNLHGVKHESNVL